jgi:hypothetical protein
LISISARKPRLCAAMSVLALCVGGLMLLAGCNTNYNLGATGSVGVGNNVAITTASNITQLFQGSTLAIQATVANDTSNQGVTWSMTGAGSLSSITGTTVTYVAPTSGVTGATSAQIFASAVANPAYTAEVTLVTLGAPVMDAGGSASNPGALYPGSANVLYAAQLTVVGGTGPFTWALASGSTLPAGLSLGGNTDAVTTISGTPTAAGTYAFTVQATDATGLVASEALTLTINPQAGCVLNGQYAFTFTGFRGGSAATYIGNVTISSSGTVSGEQDYKDGHRTTVQETLLSTSNCQNISTNTGFLRLFAPSGQIDFTFAAAPPDASGVIHSARLQLVSSGADSGSGELALSDTTAFSGKPPSGNFAFGMLGVDGNNNHYGSAGRFSSSAAGSLSGGLVDSNGGSASAFGASVSNAALTGTLSSPDVLGRGTATLTSGSATSALVYYIVNAHKLFVMNINAPVNTARETGYMTSQVGNVTASNSFDNTAFSSPSILSLWGNSGVINPSTFAALGRLANANTAAATVDVTLDVASGASAAPNLLYSAQTYSIAPSGRGTMTVGTGSSASPLVFYLDGAGSGYVVQHGSATGNAGFLEAQAPPPPGGYNNTLAGTFVGGTQYPQSAGPIMLVSLVYIDFGALSSAYTNGTFSIDPTSGRGFAQISFTGVGALDDVMYIVSPAKVDLMNFGNPGGTNATILWLIQ